MHNEAPPYRNPNLPISERVSDLLARMTLREKVAQLMHHWKSTDKHNTIDKYKADGVGSAYVFWVEDLHALQKHCIENTRLGIPVSYVTEALHGGASGGTIFPMPVAMAATWNEALIGQVYTHIAKEARMAGANQSMSPMVDLATDPRFGRVDEGYGEDPYLTAVFVTVAVRHMQGDSEILDAEHIAATTKHFAAYGMAENGQDGGSADLSEQALRERYLVPFHAAVKADTKAIMPSHSEINGVPCHGNEWLLTTLLRDEWGFEGMVVGDAGDCNLLCAFGLAKDYEDAGIQCVTAGVDQELYVSAYEYLESAVEKGLLPESIIDRSVRRVLRFKMECGLFENPYPQLAPAEDLDSPAGRALAYQSALESMVLLKNTDDFLPLDPAKLKTVALIGPNADHEKNQLGLYCRYGAECVTIKQGLENRLPAHVVLKTAEGCNIMDDSSEHFAEAVKLAAEADVVILALGDSMESCRECYGSKPGDRAGLDLSGGQQALLDQIAAVNPNTVLVLINGRPQSIVAADAKLPAILEAWRPGEEGGHAVADILLGQANPSGKLTMTFPRSVGQLPIYYYRKKRSFLQRQYAFESPTPLYPFGFGLSYTRFDWSDFSVTPENVLAETMVNARINITNTGKRAGAEVVQIYAHDPLATMTRPMRQLVAFKKVELAAGESVTLEIPIEVARFGFYDRDKRFVIEDGVIELFAARHALEDGLQQDIWIGKMDTSASDAETRSVADALIPD